MQIVGGTVLDEVVVLEAESLEDVILKCLLGDCNSDDSGIGKTYSRWKSRGDCGRRLWLVRRSCCVESQSNSESARK